MDGILKVLLDNYVAYLRDLAEFVVIPSVSTDPAHESDVQRAADWVVNLRFIFEAEEEIGSVILPSWCAKGARRWPATSCYRPMAECGGLKYQASL